MSLISRVIGSASGGLLDSISNLADELFTSDDERNTFKLQMQQLMQQRDSEIEQSLRAELQAKERIMVAEMTQGDNYTKRARPTVVYAGLFIIFFNYCLVPALQAAFSVTVEPFALPTEFWAAWGGCVGIWSIGRSVEKTGVSNKATQAITGNKFKLLD
jgi:hypothetical protein